MCTLSQFLADLEKLKNGIFNQSIKQGIIFFLCRYFAEVSIICLLLYVPVHVPVCACMYVINTTACTLAAATCRY